ncbi:MAG TPA: M20/M25/M40 family metallo-hydrolase [Vicinamibacterales bacterium]|nr:M20/M25/M40 family metallo-hydrolase [Vicinamibacterales bacterium]
MTRTSFTPFLLLGVTAVLMAAQPAGGSKFSAALAERPDVQQALTYIDDHFDAQVKEWIALTEIPAPSTHEEKRAAYLRGQLEAMGLKPAIDGIGNVVARRPGTGGGPAIAFVAHMDTVHPLGTDVTVKRLPDGTLHAPGILDDTPSDVALLQMLRALDAAKIRTKGDLILIFSVQEELGLKGMYYWYDHNPKSADMIVAVDAELGAVDYGALGIYWSKMKFTAPGAHTLNSRGAPHPARAAAQCISDIYTVQLPPANAPVSAIYNVGMIGGGTVVNAVAPEVWFTVDLRTIDPALLTKLDAEIVGKCEAAAKTQKVTFAREYIQKSEAGGRPEQLADRLRHPLVRTAVDVLNYLNLPILPNGAPAPTGSTDANVGVTRGVPSIAIGRGKGGNQHSLSEWADIESARPGTKQIVLLALSLAEIQ